MKTILYTSGPPRITCGAAGTFERGVPRTIAAEMADRLLAKRSITFTEVVADASAPIESKPRKKKKE